MKNSNWLKIAAPLAVAALALSACGGAKPGAMTSPSSVATLEQTPLSTTASTPPSETSTSETPTSEAPTSETPTSEAPTSETPTSESPTSSESSDGPSDAAGSVDAAAKKYAATVSGSITSLSAELGPQNESLIKAQKNVTFEPAVCRDLSLSAKMLPSNGFEVASVSKTSGTTGMSIAGFVKADATKLAELKTLADRAIAECATIKTSASGQTASTTNSSFPVSIDGAEIQWGSKAVVTANGQTTTMYAVFAFAGDHGVNIAVFGPDESEQTAQELAQSSFDTWG